MASEKLGMGLVILQKTRPGEAAFQEAANFGDVLTSLDHLRKVTSRQLNTFELFRGAKVFDRNRLYLMKPIGQRFWTQTAALNDADEIAGYPHVYASGGSVSVFGNPTEWADLINPMVPQILELVLTTWEGMPSPSPDEKEDDITNKLCQALQQNRTARSLMFHILTQYVELDPLLGEDQGRLDIVFLPLVPREDIYFCIECKRLNVYMDGKVRAYAAEYIKYGMIRFITGQYSKSVRHGGMMAYVLDGNIPHARANIEKYIRKQYAALHMRAPGDMLPSTVLMGNARVRETHHRRRHEVTVFYIHHLFISN